MSAFHRKIIRRSAAAMLAFLMTLAGDLSSAGWSGGAAGGAPPLHQPLPRGGILDDGEILIDYTAWDFKARAFRAERSGGLFNPGELALPFESEASRESFLERYSGGRWHLLDIVYSSLGGDEIPQAEKSAAYLVKDSESEVYEIIAINRNAEGFRLHFEAQAREAGINAQASEYIEALAFQSAGSESPLPLEEEGGPGLEEIGDSEGPPAELADSEPDEGEEAALTSDGPGEIEEPDAAEGIEADAPAEEAEAGVPEEGSGSPAAEEDAPAEGPLEEEQPQKPLEEEFQLAPAEGAAATPQALEVEGDGEESSIGALIASALDIFSVNAYASEFEGLAAASGMEGGGSLSGASIQASEPRIASGSSLEAAPLPVIQKTSGGVSAVEVELKPESRVSVISLELLEPMGLRSAAASGTFAPDISGDVNAAYFPVTFYDYEWTSTGIQYSGGDYNREVATYDFAKPNFNTPEALAEKNESDDLYYYADSNGDVHDLRSYFLFNPPLLIDDPTYLDIGRQNVDFVKNTGNKTVSYGDGVTLGIAADNLDHGFQLNYRTMDNLSIFPKIEDSLKSSNEVYIYGDSSFGEDQPLNQNDGVQSDALIGDLGMITAYPDYNFPFIKDASGYYGFDSDRYHVHVDPSAANKNLILNRGKQATPDYRGFFPLNGDDVANKSDLNYNFGMNFGFDFIIPADGKVNGNDLEFSFVGDDDVWVYIDGRLALDLGGTHKRASGSINFNSGLITIASAKADNEDLNKVYVMDLDNIDAGAALDNPATGPVYWNLYGAEGETTSVSGTSVMKDVGIDRESETHSIQIFYVERGPSESNASFKFNLAPAKPGALNVSKAVINPGDTNEVFSFDVYAVKANATNVERNDDGKITAIIEGQLTNAPHETYTIFRDESFSIDEEQIPPPEVGEAYSDYLIKIVEDDTDLTYNYKSTLMESALFPNDIPGTDSGWFVYNNQFTSTVKVTNALPDPITIVKRDAGNPNKVLPGVKFDLHKVSLNADGTPNYGVATEIESDLTTNSSGRILLNTPENQQLEKGSLYKLVEQGSGKEIYFWMTDSLLPKVRKVYQLDDGGYEIPFDATDSTTGKLITSAFGTADGLAINIYNNVTPTAKSSIVVEKTIDASEEDFTDGALHFLFKVEKLDGQENVVQEWVKSVEITDGYDEASTTFDDLDVGFKYRISELKSIRYEVDVITYTKGTNDTLENVNASLNNSDNQPVILLGNLGDQKSVVQFDNENVFDKRMSSSALKVNNVSLPIPSPGGNGIVPTKPKVVEVEFIRVIRETRWYNPWVNEWYKDWAYFYVLNSRSYFIVEGDSVDATGIIADSQYTDSRFVLLPELVDTLIYYDNATALTCLTTYRPSFHQTANSGLGPMATSPDAELLNCYYASNWDYSSWLIYYANANFRGTGGAAEILDAATPIFAPSSSSNKRYIVYRSAQTGTNEEWWGW